MSDRLAHVASIIAGVVAVAARDAGRSRIVIVDHAAPECALLERLLRAGGFPLPTERAGTSLANDAQATVARETVALEELRAHARRMAGSDGLAADPVNKTVAVLFPELLAEPLLPLADLYATQVRALGSDWSAPAVARAFIERAGGVEAVDAFLVRHLEERRPMNEALTPIPGAPARHELAERFRAGWWWRRRVGVVPKLGTRTLGLDLR